MEASSSSSCNSAPRRRPERAGKGSEGRNFGALVDSIDGIVWEADARSFQMTYVSAKAEQLLGYPAERWLERDFWQEHIHPEDRVPAVNYCLTSTRARENHEFEYRFRAADGRWVWLHDIVTVVLEEGEAVSLCGVMVDITRQKETEQALRETLERFELVAAGSNGAICDWDLVTRKVYYSPRWLEMRGYAPGEVGDSEEEWRSRVHPEDAERVNRALNDHLEGRTPFYAAEYRTRCKDGSWKWIMDRGVAKRDERGVAVRIAGSEVDVTELHRAMEELKESRRLLEKAQQVGRIGSWVSAGGGLEWSAETCRIFGVAPEAFDGRSETFYGLVHAEDRAAVRECSVRAHRERTAYQIEHRIVRPDGAVRWVREQADVEELPGPEGGLRMIGVVQDITTEREALEALQQGEERWRMAVVAARMGTWSVDVERGLVEWSESYGALHGRVRADFPKTTEENLECVHAEDRARVWQALERAISENEPFECEFRVVWRDGTVRWLSVRGQAQRDGAGRAVRMVGVGMDVTERKDAEEQLKRREEHFRLLIENASDLITVIDNRGKIIYQSPSSRRALGLEPEELLGRSAFEYVHPDDTETMAAAIQRALTNPDAPVVVEYRFRHVSGDWRVLQSVGRNLPGMAAQGFIVVNSRDVTESRGLQEQLAQAQKLQAVGTLAGGIAHDFNNLLGAIIGNADLALFDVPENAPAARFLEEILKASHRAKELVERILAFSRPRPAQRQVLQMGPIVEDAARLLRSTLPAGVELRMQVPAQLPPVRVDGSAIHQITLNLGTNSWHALHGKPGQIAISLERAHLDEQFCRAHSGVRPGEFVCLRVADNGSGMDAATMRRIFEPFFTTKPTGKGTGLGLSVVHGLVQSHGGAIVVESEPGVGSDFRVYFPAAQGPAAEVAPKPPAAAADARGGGGARILLVDDEKALLEIGRQALERRGFRVSAHASPVEAFKHFEAGPEMVDLLITDYNMPGMSGLQLAEAVLRQRPGMPVLVASGFLLPEQVAVAQAAGVTRVLAKPYSAEVLCQAALELTGAGPGRARAGQ